MQREFSEFMETITHSSPEQRWYSLVCTTLLCQLIVPEIVFLSWPWKNIKLLQQFFL